MLSKKRRNLLTQARKRRTLALSTNPQGQSSVFHFLEQHKVYRAIVMGSTLVALLALPFDVAYRTLIERPFLRQQYQEWRAESQLRSETLAQIKEQREEWKNERAKRELDAEEMLANRVARYWTMFNMDGPGIEYRRTALEGLVASGESLEKVYITCEKFGIKRDNECVEKPNLNAIKLDGANIKFANFGEVNLSRSSFREIVGSGVWFWKSDVSSSNFYKAKIEWANFFGSDLTWARFVKANIRNSKFNQAYMHGVTFDEADAYNVDFGESDLTFSTFKGAIVAPDDVDRFPSLVSSFDGANISYVDFDGVVNLQKNQLKRAWAWNDQPPRNLPKDVSAPIYCDSKFRWGSIKYFGKPDTC